MIKIYQNDSIINNRYEVQEMINRGQQGIIYKVFDQFSKQVKTIKQQQLALDNEKQIYDILKLRAYNNVVKIYDSFSFKGNFFIVMEYLFAQTLSEYLQSNSVIDITDAISQILQGVHCLHMHNIIHRDLKPDNILVCDGIFKIIDFSSSRLVEQQQMKMTIQQGTYTYMAPEVMNSQQYNHKADIWSLGLIWYDLYSPHQHLYDDMKLDPSSQNFYMDLFKMNKASFKKVNNKMHKDIIQKMLNLDPNFRPNIISLLKWIDPIKYQEKQTQQIPEKIDIYLSARSRSVMDFKQSIVQEKSRV